jgi:hypothetical protein
MSHKLLFAISTIGLILLMVLPVQADDTWQLVRECVTESSERPTWDGTILFTDWAGIHGLSAEYPTPFVAAFIRWEDRLLGGPGLSPDGRWYAIPVGDFAYGEDYDVHYDITAIHVYSTEDRSIVYKIDWPYSYTVAAKYWQFRWLDNERILLKDDAGIGIKVLDFQSGTANFLSLSVDPFDMEFNYRPVIYPDLAITRAIRYKTIDHDDDHAFMTWEVVNVQTHTVLNTLTTPDLPEFRWTFDSTHFIAEIDTPDGVQMVLFDRDGNPADTPFTLPDEQRIMWTRWSESRSSAWSPDGRYFAFVANPPTDHTDRYLINIHQLSLYIADFETHSLIDPCISSVSSDMAWSPDSRFLALDGAVKNVQQKKNSIYLLDPQTHQMFPIAYHTALNSGIIGWRQ